MNGAFDQKIKNLKPIKKKEGSLATILSHICGRLHFFSAVHSDWSFVHSFFNFMNIEMKCRDPWLFMDETRIASWTNEKKIKKRDREKKKQQRLTSSRQETIKKPTEEWSKSLYVNGKSRSCCVHHKSMSYSQTKIIWIRVLHTSIIFTSAILWIRTFNQTG